MRYSAALEEELWALRESRLTALRSHSEHHRLVREHGAVAAQALQDPLTGLPNRRALDLRLRETSTSASGQPCAIALIDLDRFKAVNDARSHAAGDAVLRAVASALRTALRAQDLVARYGGDEFVVVLPATTLPVAQAALTRATQAVAELPVDMGAGVTMSVGVVRMPHGGLARRRAGRRGRGHVPGEAGGRQPRGGRPARAADAPPPRPPHAHRAGHRLVPACPAPRERLKRLLQAAGSGRRCTTRVSVKPGRAVL